MTVPPRHADSDEDTPAAVGHASSLRCPSVVSLLPLPLVTSSPAMTSSGHQDRNTMDTLCDQLRSRYEAMVHLPEQVPPVVSFRVGGQLFAVSRALLEMDPGSLLFLLTVEEYTAPASANAAPMRGQKRTRGDPVSGKTVIFVDLPDRNPRLFAMLLNLLRGYYHAVLPLWKAVCEEEAAYYGLVKSWNLRFPPAAAPYAFRCPLNNANLTSDAVLAVASAFLTAGDQRIDFALARCERAGVGLISSTTGRMEDLCTNAQDGSDGAFFWSDGKVSVQVGEPRVAETGFPFPTGALVRVTFDVETRIARWLVNGEYCVATERLPVGRHYAFAAIASRASQVVIKPS